MFCSFQQADLAHILLNLSLVFNGFFMPKEMAYFGNSQFPIVYSWYKEVTIFPYWPCIRWPWKTQLLVVLTSIMWLMLHDKLAPDLNGLTK